MSDFTHSRSTRHPTLLATAAMVLGAIVLALSPVRGGSIFDDDYTPPKRAEPPPTAPVGLPAPVETPTPLQRPAPTVRPPDGPPATPANESPAVHQAVPDRANRAKSRKLFEEVYAKELKDRAPAARKKLAQALLDEAGKTAEGSSDRFVLLNGAIQAAEEGQSLQICFSAAKRLAKEFGVDELAAKTDAATKAFAGAPSPALSSVSNIEALMALADELAGEDAFNTVMPVESALQKAMPGISDAELKAEVKNQIREMAADREARDKAAPAIAKLRQSTDDLSANLAVGSYLCFRRGQWDKGLPLLAKSSDAQLKDLAAADLACPAGADELSKLADRWFAIASKLPGPDRAGAMQRAGELYHRAETGLTGLQKLAIEKRRAQIPSAGRHRRVNLLELFDPATSIVKGAWRIQDGVLVADPIDAGRVDFLYEPPDEYDFRISFTVVHEEDCITQICYCAGHQFDYPIGGGNNTFTAFEMVGGQEGRHNKTTKEKNHWLASGQHYISVIKVRAAGVEAYLDGQLVTSLKTDYSDMDVRGPWKLSRNNVVGIGASNESVRFDAVEIIEITGEGRLLSP